jgi:hypothetical protein
MYDHILRMLEAGPGVSLGTDVIKLDRVFFPVGTDRVTAVASYRPLVYQADLLDYVKLPDTRITLLPDSPKLPSAAAELTLKVMLEGMSDINVDTVAQKTSYVSQAMELATMVESSCEASIRLGAGLILLGLAIDRNRN